MITKEYLSSFLTEPYDPEHLFKNLKGVYFSMTSTNRINSFCFEGKVIYGRGRFPTTWTKI